MVTNINPMMPSDGTGRDTYILLDHPFRRGVGETPARWIAGLRSPTPRAVSHTRGYQRWYSRSSMRPKNFAPRALDSSVGRGVSDFSAAVMPTTPRKAWYPHERGFSARAWDPARSRRHDASPRPGVVAVTDLPTDLQFSRTR
eukprot:TRINITY_DN74272_c0_g1_i1.p1 TRINITY_DN74272_c0_g1~~TRINITY_DN74272_c0_g1_i1.p1  ORF type:complete len:143 (+),score=2.63 TRINITY_DN74272_c0_g1_i1:73-501(+)